VSDSNGGGLGRRDEMEWDEVRWNVKNWMVISFQRALASRERTPSQSDEEGATFTSAGWRLYNATMGNLHQAAFEENLVCMFLLFNRMMS
jgi:hypothetical protein